MLDGGSTPPTSTQRLLYNSLVSLWRNYMSASSEKLLEQIHDLERRIQIAESSGGDASLLKEQLTDLSIRFSVANQALNEGKAVLKG